jgi:uncharacterized protein YjbI with pentapeptide repeats
MLREDNMGQKRLNYEDSCRRLQQHYLAPGHIPPMPNHLPQSDDTQPLGVTFFRTFVGDGDDLGNLTLPRTFFGRSEINDVSFQNTDLTESNLCWNVDFTDAVLTGSDLRASVFSKVKFLRADLRGADMRRSSFENCVFDGALMDRAILSNGQRSELELSDEQREKIEWTNDDGPEPDGG